MSTPKVDEAEGLLQPLKHDVKSRSQGKVMEGETMSMGIKQDNVHNFKHLKSFYIVKLALTIFTSDYKLMFSMMISIIPFFVFMVFYEIKLQKVLVTLPSVLINPYMITVRSVTSRGYSLYTDLENEQMKFLFDVLQLCLLYLIVYPLLELLSMATTIQIAAKVYAGERPSSIEDVFYRINNLKGVMVNCGYVHLLSFLSLFGLSWIVMVHLVCTGGSSLSDFWPLDISNCLVILVIGIHLLFLVAVLYKYVDWSASWNMIMVISVLEDESRLELDAFDLTTYYGLHCKPTGFYLMLGFMGFSSVLRLICLHLYGGLSSFTAVTVTSVVIVFLCLGNLVKWVAFVLYYFDCKQQTMKKNDLELGKATIVVASSMSSL